MKYPCISKDFVGSCNVLLRVDGRNNYLRLLFTVSMEPVHRMLCTYWKLCLEVVQLLNKGLLR